MRYVYAIVIYCFSWFSCRILYGYITKREKVLFIVNVV